MDLFLAEFGPEVPDPTWKFGVGPLCPEWKGFIFRIISILDVLDSYGKFWKRN